MGPIGEGCKPVLEYIRWAFHDGAQISCVLVY